MTRPQRMLCSGTGGPPSGAGNDCPVCGRDWPWCFAVVPRHFIERRRAVTREAIALHPGDRIHVQPHDIYAGWPVPFHHTRIDAHVCVAGTARSGRLVIVCWRGPGEVRGAVVYDQDAQVELDEAAAA
jgi:hypothetical protein